MNANFNTMPRGRITAEEYADLMAKFSRETAMREQTIFDLLVALKLARECIAYCRKNHNDAQSGEGVPAEMILDIAIAKAEAR